MPKFRVTQYIALCSACLLATGYSAFADQSLLRLALVDVGGKSSVPPELIDLLTVELSQTPNFELLERREIDRVLREQELNLRVTNNDAKDIVTAGNILGARALLLVSAEQEEKNVRPIRIQIVETTRGARFGETVVAWSNDSRAIATQLQSVGRQIRNRLQRIANTEESMTVVSVAGFQSNELSPEAQRVRRDLESWLEAWLSGQSGIVIAERTRVLPLIDERKLAADLPAQLGDADATVDGTFRIDFSSEPPTIELTLRVVKRDKTTATRKFRASIHELSRLQRETGKSVLELLSLDESAFEFDAKAESQLLADEAERLLLLEHRQEARRRLIAAYALTPESYQVQALVLRAGIPRATAASDSNPESSYPTALFVCDVARQVLDKIALENPPPDGQHFYHPEYLLARAVDLGIGIEYLHRQSKHLTAEGAAQYEWYRMAISGLFRRSLTVSKSINNRCYNRTLLQGLCFSPYWEKTPEAALALRRELLRRAYRLLQTGFTDSTILTYSNQLFLERNEAWAHRKDLPKLFKLSATELAASEQPFLQARGTRALAIHAYRMLEDRDLAKQHYRRFIDLIVKELIPKYPTLSHELAGYWLEIDRGSEPRLLTDAEAGEMWGRIIRAAWSDKCPRASQPWLSRIKTTAYHLEQAQEIDEARRLLDICINKLEHAIQTVKGKGRSSQWPRSLAQLRIALSELSERYPDTVDEDLTTNELAVSCVCCLNQGDLESAWLGAGLVPPEIRQQLQMPQQQPQLKKLLAHMTAFAGVTKTDSGLAVLSVAEQLPGPGSQNTSSIYSRIAVTQLDRSGTPLSTKVLPDTFEHSPSRFNLHQTGISFLWPMTATGGELFVAPSENGLIHITREGESVHYSSKYLTKSDSRQKAAPFQKVWQLVTCNNRIYAKCGNPMQPTFYEFVPNQHTFEQLLNTSTLAKDHPLYGKRGFLMMAGRDENLLLWVNTGRYYPRKSRHPLGSDLYLFSLKKRAVSAIDTPLFVDWMPLEHMLSDEHSHKAIYQTLGYLSPQGDLAAFDASTCDLVWWAQSTTAAPPPNNQIRLSCAFAAASDQYLLTSLKRVGGVYTNDWNKQLNFVVKNETDSDFSWLLFKRGRSCPQKLVAHNLPAPSQVKRFFFIDERRILMMTRDKCYEVTLPDATSTDN